MSLTSEQMMGRRRAALVLLILGALLVCIDVRYTTSVAYPNYEFVEDYGPNTQRMIIEDVVGTRLTIDFGSELIGYLFLLISIIIVRTYAKPELSMKKEMRKLASKFGWLMPRAKLKFIMLPAYGLVSYAAARLLPFVFNSLLLYSTEYVINFGLVITEAATLLFCTLCFLRECDRFQNHKETQFIYLFLILTVFSGILKNFAAFYGVTGVQTIYMIVNTVTVVVMCGALLHYVHTEDCIARMKEAEAGIGKVGPEDYIFFKS